MAVRRGGSGLLGLVIIIGVLYYSGAGNWLWQRVLRMGDACYSLMASSSAVSRYGTPVCNGVSRAVGGLEGFGDRVVGAINDWKMRSSVDGSGALSSLLGLGDALQSRLSGLGSGSEELSRIMREGPGALVGDHFRQSLDSFSIGQHYLDSGSVAKAVPWLQQGAAQPSGYGLMSQLSLGNLYSQGGSGVSADPMQAQAYYMQARQSLSALSASDSPQAQQLLQSLPQGPEALQQQLDRAIAAFKNP